MTETLTCNFLNKECPMYKCVPCDYGYVIDDKGCQTCECKKKPGK